MIHYTHILNEHRMRVIQTVFNKLMRENTNFRFKTNYQITNF